MRSLATFRPAKIILFGSYASGPYNEDSDVDLLVVMPYRGASYRMASRLAHGNRCGISARHRGAFSSGTQTPAGGWGDSFLTDIVEQGIVPHDANDRRVGEQGRRRFLTPFAFCGDHGRLPV